MASTRPVLVSFEQWTKMVSTLRALRNFVDQRSLANPSATKLFASEARELLNEHRKVEGMRTAQIDDQPRQSAEPDRPEEFEESLQAQAPPSVPDLPRLYQALYDFTASNEHQLSFREGALLMVLSQSSPQWWVGRDSAGNQGFIPHNFVQPSSGLADDCGECGSLSGRLHAAQSDIRALKLAVQDASQRAAIQQEKEKERSQATEGVKGKGEQEKGEEAPSEQVEEVREEEQEGAEPGGPLEDLPLLLADVELRLMETLGERDCLAQLISPSAPLVARYDFTAAANDQLSFRKGDVLSLLQCGSGGWWRARSPHDEGLIPCDSLRLPAPSERDILQTASESIEAAVSSTPAVSSALSAPVETSLSAPLFYEALHDFEASAIGQLPFAAGDVLEVVAEGPPSGWSLARDLAGRLGVVPHAFLQTGSECTRCSQGESKAPEGLPPLSFWLREAAVRGAQVAQLQAELRKSSASSSDLRYFYQALYDFRAERSEHLSFKQGDELQILKRGGAGWGLARHSDGREGLIPWNYVQLSCQGAVVANEKDEECLDLLLPSGCIVTLNNLIMYPDGSSRDENGVIHSASGIITPSDAHSNVLLDGCVLLDNGCFRYPSGTETTPEGRLRVGQTFAEPAWQLPARTRGKVMSQ